MKKVYEHFEHDGMYPELRTYAEDSAWVLPGCGIGIELEYENFRSRPGAFGKGYWMAVEDGSLRSTEEGEPYELKLRMPLSGADLTQALSDMAVYLRGRRNISVSPRTSLHVHMDVREMPVDKLCMLVVLFAIFERPLFRYCGADREGNNFCLPLAAAEAALNSIDFEQMVENLDRVVRYIPKYSALNLGAIRRFGSVEFRCHPGTRDMDRVREWVNILMCLKRAAMEMRYTAEDLPRMVSEIGGDRLGHEVFGGDYAALLMYPDFVSHTLEGVRYAQDLIYNRSMILFTEECYRQSYEAEGEDLFTKYCEKQRKPVKKPKRTERDTWTVTTAPPPTFRPRTRGGDDLTATLEALERSRIRQRLREEE